MTTLLSDSFRFWTPPGDFSVSVGPEQQDVPLPQLPLPVKAGSAEGEPPSDDAIGSGIYDYLRQFPDCEHNRAYAEILRDAYPHYLADLGSLIVMLDHKDVDAPYVRRKVVALQILLLLQPENRGLQMQLGICCFELAMMFSELTNCRELLHRASRYLAAVEDDPGALNYLARIDYIIGDYPKAIARWEQLAECVDAETAAALQAQVESIRQLPEPERSLLEDLEAIGHAMQLMAGSDTPNALRILERIEEEQILPQQFPNPEFYYMLGICRERCGDPAGAFAAFDQALELDPEHQPSCEARDRIAGG